MQTLSTFCTQLEHCPLSLYTNVAPLKQHLETQHTPPSLHSISQHSFTHGHTSTSSPQYCNFSVRTLPRTLHSLLQYQSWSCSQNTARCTHNQRSKPKQITSCKLCKPKLVMQSKHYLLHCTHNHHFKPKFCTQLEHCPKQHLQTQHTPPSLHSLS